MGSLYPIFENRLKFTFREIIQIQKDNVLPVNIMIMAGYGLDIWVSIHSRRKRFLSQHCIQTGFGPSPASYPLDNENSFPGG
jgi:hypothetical protein